MALTIVLVAVGCFLFGVGLTRSLMQPQLCPRCGAYMRSRGREVADWLRRRKQNREGVDGKSSPERK
jgi:hypothetical protein